MTRKNVNELKKDGIMGMEYLCTGKKQPGYNLDLVLFSSSLVDMEMIRTIRPFGYCLHEDMHKFKGFILALHGDIREIERYCNRRKKNISELR